MSVPSVAQRAVVLPWLRPATPSLLALTDDRPDADLLRADPALVLHFVRFLRPTPTADTFALDDGTLLQPGPCDTAAEFLDRIPDVPALHPQSPSVVRGRQLASLAFAVAERTGLCSPDAGWVAGLLSPLGEYAAETADDSDTLEADWGMTPEQIARRLCGRWRLPSWLTVAVGFPQLTPKQATGVGGHAGLTTVLAEARSGFIANVPAGSWLTEPAEPAGLLPKLLRMTAKARRRSAETWIVELEARIDGLTAALDDAGTHFAETLHEAKLSAMAEFAAGASHEINNPLAVIAGNVQRLMAKEADPDKRTSLAVALRQTKRIQQLLLGTRQFARPPQPSPEVIRLSSFCADAVQQVAADADAKGIRVDADAGDAFVLADAAHLMSVLGHLLRNAVEAAGDSGWVQIGTETTDGTVSLIIDDSGPGPAESALPHLFDPFFSSRSAGRGRGLGLSIAWRLARQNGGDLRHVARPGLPTRFVLTLPRAAEIVVRKSA